jgi:hypothetical protein
MCDDSGGTGIPTMKTSQLMFNKEIIAVSFDSHVNM